MFGPFENSDESWIGNAFADHLVPALQQPQGGAALDKHPPSGDDYQTFWETRPMSYREVSEIRDGMRIDWDMPITMDDGLVVRADIFRPVKNGRYPVILSYGPYAKWLHFE